MYKQYQTYWIIYIIHEMDQEEKDEFIEDFNEGADDNEKFEEFNDLYDLGEKGFVKIEPLDEDVGNKKYLKKVYLASDTDDLRDKISSDHFEINMCGYNVINETDTRGEYFESYEEQINRYIKEINRAKSNFKQLLISAIILAIILLII